MLLNKWIQFALSLLAAVVLWASAFDWTSLFSAKTAAIIGGVVASIKLVTNALAPAPGATTQPTGGAVITQKAA